MLSFLNVKLGSTRGARCALKVSNIAQNANIPIIKLLFLAVKAANFVAVMPKECRSKKYRAGLEVPRPMNMKTTRSGL
jgi:hypothetical protein